MTRVSWDERKRLAVIAARGVDFIDAAGIFENPCFTREDRRRDYGEPRFITVGESEGVHYVVVYTPRRTADDEHVLHLITAWRAGRRTRQRYQDLLAGRASGDA
ncbi:MAG: BrnT family toxin [Blastochloris sp.]|nr:BrnT family toxin [Blastochloris sp.]